MKILLFVLGGIVLILIFYKAATMPETTMSLNAHNMPVPMFLHAVKDRFGISWFLEDDSVGRMLTPITTNLKNATLHEVVDTLQAHERRALIVLKDSHAPFAMIEISSR
jgi:hypothetical protein